MMNVLAIGLQGMQQDMARLDRIAMNLANASTPGYKREVASAQPLAATRFADVMEASANARIRADSPPDPARLLGGSVSIRPDMQPGTLRGTGQPLDVSLTGPGFFEISTKAGLAYTRQGDWHLDGQGRLVTAQGDPVMGEGGEIVLPHPSPRIDAKGRIFDAAADGAAGVGVDPVPAAQLKVVNFATSDPPRRLGEGMFEPPAAPESLLESEVDVRQGYLENANVNSMREMTQLIQSMRHFESMQKVVMNHDDMIGTAVSRLGASA
jgi:flagellar basal-body rod protein FlgG